MADILVVDDLETTRHLLCRVLLEMGHNVTEASNGVEALAFCRENRFDLLILDYHVPKMDGLEVAGRLKGKVRFILHTSDFDNKDVRQKALDAGALDVIAKISSVEAFKRHIETFLNL
jgi:CheY-like chemotaxis protein